MRPSKTLMPNQQTEQTEMQYWEKNGVIMKMPGGLWKILRTMTFHTPYGDVKVPEGYIWDRDTWVKNLPDWGSSLAHDWLYQYRLMADGGLATKTLADAVYLYLNRSSHHWLNRKLAGIRDYGLRKFPITRWIAKRMFNKPGRPEKVPEQWQLLFDKR